MDNVPDLIDRIAARLGQCEYSSDFAYAGMQYVLDEFWAIAARDDAAAATTLLNRAFEHSPINPLFLVSYWPCQNATLIAINVIVQPGDNVPSGFVEEWVTLFFATFEARRREEGLPYAITVVGCKEFCLLNSSTEEDLAKAVAVCQSKFPEG